MPLVQDHKRAFEGDVGPNTGGMGSYSMEDHMLPFITKGERERAVEAMKMTVEALHQEGCPYKGVLYGQFMLTSAGPRIIEFNSRFGDPEAMNVLPILQTDFVEVSESIVSGTLSQQKVDFARKATVCKYVVPEGYGVEPKADRPIKVNEKGVEMSGAELFYAAVNEVSGKILTSTSRAVAVVGIASHLEEAEKACEQALKFVSGEDLYVRHDIGRREIIQKKIARMQAIRK